MHVKAEDYTFATVNEKNLFDFAIEVRAQIHTWQKGWQTMKGTLEEIENLIGQYAKKVTK